MWGVEGRGGERVYARVWRGREETGVCGGGGLGRSITAIFAGGFQ